MTSLAPRIGQLFRLAFCSDELGKIVAAIEAIKRALKSHGLDHQALAYGVERGLEELPAAIPGCDWKATARFCFARCQFLSVKETDFVITILNYTHEPSCKQKKWISGISARIGGEQ
jgi:hypothetical protein